MKENLVPKYFMTLDAIKKTHFLLDYLMDVLAQGGLDCTGTDNCTFNSRYQT